jgi:hypothetical protein
LYYALIIYVNSNAVINNNNNSGRLQDLILLFKNSIGAQNDFFEICVQVGQATAKRFGIQDADSASVQG